MSRNAWKKRSDGMTVPAELFSLCQSIFFELSYEAETFEVALEQAAQRSAPKTRSAVKAYLTHVAEGDYDAEELSRVWTRAARDAGWIIDGDAREASLELMAALGRVPTKRRHG
jgi:hypothetical protein